MSIQLQPHLIVLGSSWIREEGGEATLLVRSACVLTCLDVFLAVRFGGGGHGMIFSFSIILKILSKKSLPMRPYSYPKQAVGSGYESISTTCRSSSAASPSAHIYQGSHSSTWSIDTWRYASAFYSSHVSPQQPLLYSWEATLSQDRRRGQKAEQVKAELSTFKQMHLLSAS